MTNGASFSNAESGIGMQIMQKEELWPLIHAAIHVLNITLDKLHVENATKAKAPLCSTRYC